MKVYERIALWLIRRKIVAAYKKGLKMSLPFPKLVGWAAIAGSVGAACLTLASIVPGNLGVVVAAIGTFLAALSHSLPGTGGTPANP